jgi:hypothetical protein
MSITHEQAQKLIQLKMDQILGTEDSMKLSAHLHNCSECTAYAHEIKEVPNLLAPLMKRQWNVQPAPLSISALMGNYEKVPSSTFLTMRKAAITLVVMALFFSAWQFVLSGPRPASQLSPAIPPMPTPSNPTMQVISTQLTSENCPLASYMVQEQDTLDSIAHQFSVSEDTIVVVNHLEATMLRPAMELEIPVCNFTPTGTFHLATFTSTLTPIARPTTLTPGW